jgi:hypothetical protein
VVKAASIYVEGCEKIFGQKVHGALRRMFYNTGFALD